MIDHLYNVTSLALWVPFNEAWGQFDSVKACDFYRENDPTRLIDHASGWVDHGAGDVNSFHIYFTPRATRLTLTSFSATEFTNRRKALTPQLKSFMKTG